MAPEEAAMSASNCSERPAVERDATTVASIRLERARDAPTLARRHVRREITASAGRLHDIVLLTSEVVTNAVEHSRAGAVEISVIRGPTFTRIEVRNPGEIWDHRPELRSSEPAEPDEPGGWGLFLVEQLSDRWGVRDDDRTVWFEFDNPAPPERPQLDGLAWSSRPMDEIWGVLRQVRYPATRSDLIDCARAGDASTASVARLEALPGEQYESAEAVSQDPVDRRAESNPALVAITAEVCDRCGFPRVPAEMHSCIEEKARFADSVNAVSDEFDAIDERAPGDAD
jgi:anti-sigma regulatory factor (Ser/Thr protein kinase)